SLAHLNVDPTTGAVVVADDDLSLVRRESREGLCLQGADERARRRADALLSFSLRVAVTAADQRVGKANRRNRVSVSHFVLLSIPEAAPEQRWCHERDRPEILDGSRCFLGVRGRTRAGTTPARRGHGRGTVPARPCMDGAKSRVIERVARLSHAPTRAEHP